jgi:hypothetical protein
VEDGDGFLELVVLLGVVGAVVARRTQLLGKAADEGGWQTFVAGDLFVGFGILCDGSRAGVAVAHLHGADAGAEHAGDQRGAGRCTDRRGGEGVLVDDAFAGQPVEIRCRDGGVTVGADPRAHVLDRKPKDIGPRQLSSLDRTRHQAAEQEHQPNPRTRHRHQKLPEELRYKGIQGDHAQRSRGESPGPRVPQRLTSRPRALAMAALVRAARSAAAASRQ